MRACVLVCIFIFFRMALWEILNSKADKPYLHPPPIHISVVAAKEQLRVLSWSFDDSGQPRPLVEKRPSSLAMANR